MNDDVNSGGASTATVTEVTSLKDMTPAEQQAYIKDGTLPTRASSDGRKPAESGDGSDPSTPKHQEPTAEGTSGQRRAPRAERRIRQLNDAVVAKDKEIESLRAQLAAKTETKPPTSSGPADPPSKRPKLKDFTDKIGANGYADWDAAHDAWTEADDVYQREQRAIAVRDALKAEQDKLESQRTQDSAKRELAKHANAYADRVKDFRKNLSQDDFNDAFLEVKDAIDEAMQSRQELAEISNVLVESEMGPELTYYFGKHPEELDAVLAMPLRQALREIGKLEVSDKLKAPAPKTATAARRTGTNVGGRQAAPEDPLEAAIARNDTAGYIREANKRDGIETPVRWGH